MQAVNDLASKGGTAETVADLATMILERVGVNQEIIKLVHPAIVGAVNILLTSFPNIKMPLDVITHSAKAAINTLKVAKAQETSLIPAKYAALWSSAVESANCIYQIFSADVKDKLVMKKVLACIETGVVGVVGSMIGAVIGNLFIPIWGGWIGSLLGQLAGRNLGLLAAKAIK